MPGQIIVVGAGPAGMMAAIRAAQLGCQVSLFEKKPALGKKLLLSGKGRCNLTNLCALDNFLARFSHGEFLRDAFKKFFHRQLMAFFEERGVRLKVERQLRVFAANNRAEAIVQALKKELEKLKVRLIYQTAVVDLAVEKNRISGVIDHRHKFMPAERVVLATGGVSYPFTGSTGEGLSIARKFGHRVTELSPALVPLEAQEDFLRQLKGLTLKNIRLRFCDGKEEIRSEIGELLFSESGISGPLVLSLSSTVAQWLKHSQQVYAVIDLKPALSPEELDQRLLRELRLNSRKAFKNMLKGLLPQRLIEVFVMILGIDRHKLCSYITQQERQCLGRLLKNLRLRISSTRPIEEAMVTRGGLSLKDINPRTMESRLIKGLYFCGEMIDVDADTGGFNLQAAFSTGYLAGESAAINFSDPTIRLRSG